MLGPDLKKEKQQAARDKKKATSQNRRSNIACFCNNKKLSDNEGNDYSIFTITAFLL